VRPALADTDGPFMRFRSWAAQFYAEPVGDERTVYPPPYWPDRLDEAPAKATASARNAARAERAAAAGSAEPAPATTPAEPAGSAEH
jgi:hypothetical protein